MSSQVRAESFTGFFVRGVGLFDRLYEDYKQEASRAPGYQDEAEAWLKDAHRILEELARFNRRDVAASDDIIAHIQARRGSLDNEAG